MSHAELTMPPHPTCYYVVCEAKSRIAPRLRTDTVGPPAVVREVRSLQQTFAAVAELPTSTVVLDVPLDRAADYVDAIHRLKARFRVALVAWSPWKFRPHACKLYEAGADIVAWSAIDLPRIRGLGRRQAWRSESHASLLRAAAQTSSEPDRGLQTCVERIWEQLHWNRYATVVATTPKSETMK